MKLEEVKRAMVHKEHVRYKGTEYYITACTMRIRERDWYYQLELYDLNAKSVIVVSMEEVNYDLSATPE